MALVFVPEEPPPGARYARSGSPGHRLLVNKYYVDEFYDAAIVEPIRIVSEQGLWKGVDARVDRRRRQRRRRIVRQQRASLRLLQSGSVRVYAVSLLLGVVAILGYYLWR